MVSSNLVLRRLVLLGSPLILAAVLMLFHPSPYEDLAGQLLPTADWWF